MPRDEINRSRDRTPDGTTATPRPSDSVCSCRVWSSWLRGRCAHPHMTPGPDACYPDVRSRYAPLSAAASFLTPP